MIFQYNIYDLLDCFYAMLFYFKSSLFYLNFNLNQTAVLYFIHYLSQHLYLKIC